LKAILVLGGHGVFGSLVADELADLPVIRASRRTGVDVHDRESLRRAIGGASVVVHAAGPFGDLSVVETCAEFGVPYVDIADSRAYLERLLARSWPMPMLTGISTVPCLSGMLLRKLGADGGDVAFFIGNRNAKGAAAIASFFSYRGPTWTMRFPPPIGLKRVHGLDPWPGVRVGVAFELDFVSRALEIAPALPAKPLEWASRAFARLGTERGCLVVDAGRRAWVMSERRGQRMAAIPAAVAARMLFEGRPVGRPPHLWCEPDLLIDALCARGYVFGNE
jgi:hypothetical protein